jgi:hypothetical protein
MQFTPVILATGEAEIRRIEVGGQPNLTPVSIKSWSWWLGAVLLAMQEA